MMLKVKLKDIATISSGITFRSRIEPSKNGGVRVIQMKDLGYDNLVHLSKSIHIDHVKPRRNQLAKRGDIIFRSRGLTNTAALLQEDVDNTIVAAPMLRVQPDVEKVLPEFLLWWINQPSSQAYLASRLNGTMIKMVSMRDLMDLEVKLPPMEQQRKIADFFSLSKREQELLGKIKDYKALYAQGILMRMASEFSGVVSNKNYGFDALSGTEGQTQTNQGVNIMPRGKNQHVVPHPDGWAVKGAGNSKATKVTKTQKEATTHAEQIARNQGSDTKIHRRDGKIRAGNSYGNDPCPPKDKK